MVDPSAIFSPRSAVQAAKPVDLPLSPPQVAEILRGSDHLAFLDSSQFDAEQGRFSIIGWDPPLVLKTKDAGAEVRIGGQWKRFAGDPFDLLDRFFAACHIPGADGLPVPFAGGAIGYFAYDLFRFVERYERLTALDDLALPDCCLGIYDTALVYDHLQEQWYMAGTNVLKSALGIDSQLATKWQDFKSAQERSQGAGPAPKHPSEGETTRPESNFSHDDYLRAVNKALEHIYAGDIYQVNLSQRFHATIPGSPFDFFSRLRRINPSVYGGFLDFGDFSVISSSPELFLKRQGRKIETRPIKGTRPRGNTPEQDQLMREELMRSEKDLAELSMIVDLERNDLGRVCEYGTVKVEEHACVAPLPTVFHTVSTVTGMLRDDVSTIDLLRATFPGGSITGCPKIRSIQIIDDLEPTCRSVYTGSVGYVGFDGDLVLDIAIRTLIAKGRNLYFQVGGGIVADSDPEAEYEETLDKGAAMFAALKTMDQADD